MAFDVPEEIINLAPMVQEVGDQAFPSYLDEKTLKTGPEILREIGQYVVEEFETDLGSRSEWEANAGAYHRLFTGHMPPKNEPWPNCANICLPLLTVSALQFHARAYDALIPPKEVAKVYPVGDEDIPRAERVGKYMDYDILYKMPNFEEEMDKSLMQLPLVGDVHRKTFWDPERQQTVSQYVSSMDVVVNYGVRDIENAARVTHILRLRVSEIRKRVAKGIYVREAWDLDPGTETLDSALQDEVDDAQGTQESGIEHDQPRIVLEQHREWDLDGDGVAEPYVVTVDFETEKVVRITPRTHQGQVVEYWTHYVFLPNPEGYYGLGFGILIRHLNEAANGIINEVIDAGSLANKQGGFMLGRAGMKAGDLEFEHGVYQSITANVDDIRKAIWNFDFKGPNNTLYAVLGLLFEYVERVSSVSETMTGQMPASDTPATTVLALLEEGRKVFSAIHKRIHRAFKKELQKMYRLNSIFLDEELYFRVLGQGNVPDMSQPAQPIGRADFVSDDNVQPVSDPTIISRAEKVARNQVLVQDVRSNPLTANNMEANYKATMRLYKALDVENAEELLQPPPPPPDLSPEEENAGFFMEQPANVLPQQDHAWHLEMHRSFRGDPIEDAEGNMVGERKEDRLFRELTPEGRKLLDQHIQATVAALYLAAKDNEKKMVKAAVMGQGPRLATPAQ